MNIQKWGGVGSFVNGLLMIFFLLIPFIPPDFCDPTKGFDVISASMGASTILCLGIILSGLGYIPLVLALKERMKEQVPNIMRIAVIGVSVVCALWFAGTLIGIIGWPIIINAEDTVSYKAVGAVIFSLLSAGDFTAGWILLLIGLASLRFRILSGILSTLFVVKGVVMIIAIAVPTLGLAGVILGLIFYPWLGVVLFRSQS